jgi:hypothetical protein
MEIARVLDSYCPFGSPTFFNAHLQFLEGFLSLHLHFSSFQLRRLSGTVSESLLVASRCHLVISTTQNGGAEGQQAPIRPRL